VVYAFGDCRLDVDRRELWRGGELIDLEPRAFDLLAFLVQHRDRVVTKDDLLQGVWGGRIVSESALTTRINAVRRALGDDGTAQRLVRTFARRGVRFIGEVTESGTGAPDGDGAAPGEPATRPAPPRLERPSIAVLPFENLTGDPAQEYFVDGMVEEVTTAIARFPWLTVVARNSAFTYKGKAIDVRRAAGELGVRYVLEGSVRRAGNRVRITGQLIDASSGSHLWADRFDGTLDDVFDLQDRIASSVVGAIEPKLQRAEIERAGRKPTQSLDAYDLYLRATAEGYRRTREGHAEAIWLAQQALERDPAYALAMAWIANWRQMQQTRGWIPASGPEVEEGIMMARRAIAAARHDPEVLRMAGFVLAHLSGETELALEALDRAVGLNPNHAHAYGLRAMVLGWLNRNDEAVLSAEQAIRLSPEHEFAFMFYQAFAAAHMGAGRYEEALLWADRAVRANSGAPALRVKLSLCGHLGRLEEAEKCLRLLREVHPEPTVAAMMSELPKGLSPERAALMAEGLRKAGLPEK